MDVLDSPLSMRLNGGLETLSFDLANQGIERVLGVSPQLRHDLDLGDAHYSYAPYPTPCPGLAGVLVHVNEVPGFGLTYQHRPDLSLVVSIDLFGGNLLDLGRLEALLRSSFGGLFDVAEYSVATLASSDDPSISTQVHWVMFEAAPGRVSVPLPDTPALSCSIDLEVLQGDEEAVCAALTGLYESPAMLRSIRKTAVSSARTRLTVELSSPSLLELGRCAHVLENTFGNTVGISGYRVCGDLLRNGNADRVERSFASADELLPSWRAGTRDPHD